MGEKLDDTAFRDIPCRMNRHDACFSSLSTLPATSLYKLLEKLWDVQGNKRSGSTRYKNCVCKQEVICKREIRML